MLTDEMRGILAAWKKIGWVPEPDAKRFFRLAGFDVARFAWARSADEACSFARTIGYPVVAKVVSPRIVHKSDVGGVAVGVGSDELLRAAFDRFGRMDGFDGVVVDETLSGSELIVGSSVDPQFGPVVLLGVGGVSVELYRDVAIRMAPLEGKEVASMVMGLSAHRLFEGYRGSAPVDMDVLSRMVVDFSRLAMELEGQVSSVDLNPVICSAARCTIADARIVLA